MDIGRDDLAAAALAGLVSEDQAGRLWAFLVQRAEADGRRRFGTVQVLWYGGSLIVIAAMGLFSTLGFSRFGPPFLLGTAVVYGVLFAGAGVALWRRPGLAILGGLLTTVAVTMAPLAMYAVQAMAGWSVEAGTSAYRDFYIWVRAGWVPMDVAAILAAVAALSVVRFPFLTMPIAVALWFLSMDMAPWLAGHEYPTWSFRIMVSLWFGLAVVLTAWLIDLSAWSDFAFWLHLFGLLALWNGLTWLDDGGEAGRAGYALANVALILWSVFLDRRVYAVFGTVGIALYLGYLAESVFADSLLFPFALSAIGLTVIAVGVVAARALPAIRATVDRSLPAWLKGLRPPHARAAP